eukprot:4441736-Alexandrium_andersonii.AAC.1
MVPWQQAQNYARREGSGLKSSHWLAQRRQRGVPSLATSLSLIGWCGVVWWCAVCGVRCVVRYAVCGVRCA